MPVSASLDRATDPNLSISSAYFNSLAVNAERKSMDEWNEIWIIEYGEKVNHNSKYVKKLLSTYFVQIGA